MKMPMARPKLATLGCKPSALAIELTRLKASAGKELSLSSWCIASLYIYQCSTVVDFSSEKYSGAIHQLDKLDSFPAIDFELVSSVARALGL